ncbi:hypothetical protein C2S52_003815 [Perilla frutescens var. hirtella]|nr:hypothetical protein C2S52_003815 [Perilla frutescens var. hirtella]
MAAIQQPVIVVLDSDSDNNATAVTGGGDSRESENDGVITEIGSSSSSLVAEMKIVPFVKKLYEMIEVKDEAKTKSLVRWSSTGTSFIVTNPHLFAAHVLPIYFKYKHLHNFVRQLNRYGFKRIKSEQWEYCHEYFQKGKLHLMKYIKNKRQPTSMAKMKKNPTTSTVDYRQMKVEIMTLKKKLQGLEEKLASLNGDTSPKKEVHDVQANPDFDVHVHGLRHSKRSLHKPPWHGDYVKHY